jgi:hypothetical protein
MFISQRIKAAGLVINLIYSCKLHSYSSRASISCRKQIYKSSFLRAKQLLISISKNCVALEPIYVRTKTQLRKAYTATHHCTARRYLTAFNGFSETFS